jgi:pimeloyl-ACP methyl ester carboxylesterase
MTSESFKRLRKTVETEHGSFSYADAGDGQVTLFVHGLFVSDYIWHQAIDELAGERRCLAYCLPFHAGSEVREEQDLALDSQVDMLQGFCDALGLDELDLVANDTGGAIAQGLAVRDPARIRTLTLTNCEARDWMPSHDDFARLIAELAEKGELAPVLKAAYDDLDATRAGPFASTMQWPERLSDEQIRGLMDPHQATLEGARRLERFLTALAPEQLTALEPRLRELEVPTLLVWGTADTIFPLHLAEWLRDTVPGCREIVEVEGGKLFWPFERGSELVPHLRRHWEAALLRR